MAAPSYAAAGTYFDNSTTTPQIAAPSGVVSGSVVLIAAFIDGGSPLDVTLPDGWDDVEGSPVAITGGSGQHLLHVWWHRAAGNESGTYDFTLAESRYIEAQAHRYADVVGSGNPFETGPDTATETTSTLDTPAVNITTAGNDRLIVHAVTGWAGGTWTPETGFTKRMQGAFGVASLFDKAQAVAGATGDVVATTTNADKHCAWLGALIGTAATVNGTAVANLGGLVGTASGVRTVSGAANAALSGLTGAASGIRTVRGVAVVVVSFTATTTGTRTVNGTAAGNLGGLTATAAATRTVFGAANAALGVLAATILGQTTVRGSAAAVLGGLAAAASVAAPQVVSTGSWDSLISITREARQLAAAERSRPPQACPNDGEPLTNSRGVLHCAYDGWTPT